MAGHEFFIWAHRGASGIAPENTLAAFRAAEQTGADGIELDVHLSADGVPVVIHDTTLKRTTDGGGRVSDRRLEVLQRLDAGSWFSPRYAGEPLPTLEEVFKWAGDRLRLNVEIKSAAALDAILDLLKGYPHCRVLLSSFDRALIDQARRLAPELPLGSLCDSRRWRGYVRRAEACRAESFHPREDLVSPTMMAACRQAGLKVYPWTVDDPDRGRKLAELGVDGLFTNLPAELLALKSCRPAPSASR